MGLVCFRSIGGWTPAVAARGYRRAVILIRRFALDAVLVMLAAAVFASVLTSDEEPRLLVAGMSALAVLVFCARRISPLAVVVASFGIQAIGMTQEPSATVLQFVAMLLSFALAGAICRGRDAVIAAVLGIALLGYATLGIPTGAGFGDFVLSSFIAMGFFAAGWQVSRRNRQLMTTRTEAAEAAALQQARTRQALAEERARIARELHDVVSHGLSVVVVQAQAARGAAADLAGPVDQVTRRLDAMEDTAREALGEMRRMLGLLQLDGSPTDSAAPEPPSPGLKDVAALVDRARATGTDVRLEMPPLDALPHLGVGAQLAIYRVVQESLTNVLKHAPDSKVTVNLGAVGETIEVVVRNSASGLPSGLLADDAGGHGLVGMRERAAAYGGRCTAGLVEPSVFEVRLVLPTDQVDAEAGR